MKEYLAYFESFALQSFNFRGRATPLEYWVVVPLVWIALYFLIRSDLAAVQDFLAAGQRPPMNPLFYGSFVVFALTYIPRLSLNMRRLHDRDRSGMWVILPHLGFIAVLVLLCGLLGAMMNSSLTGTANSPDAPGNIVFPLVLYAFDQGNFWQEMFAVGRAFEKLGSEAVWRLLAEIYAHAGAVDVRRDAINVVREIEGQTGHTIGFAFMAGGLVCAPLIFAGLHGLMNGLPSSIEENIYGPAKVADFQYKREDDDRHNPMAGYAHLFEKTDAEKAQKREANAREVSSLYRQRVLGLDAADEGHSA